MTIKLLAILGKVFLVFGLIDLISMLIAAWTTGSFLGLGWQQLGWSSLLFILLGIGSIHSSQAESSI